MLSETKHHLDQCFLVTRDMQEYFSHGRHFTTGENYFPGSSAWI